MKKKEVSGIVKKQMVLDKLIERHPEITPEVIFEILYAGNYIYRPEGLIYGDVAQKLSLSSEKQARAVETVLKIE